MPINEEQALRYIESLIDFTMENSIDDVYSYVTVERNHVIEIRLEGFPKLDINSQLIHFKHLINLSIISCDLKEIPAEVFNLKKLENLDLGSNHLTTLPKNLQKLKKLKKIFLNNNPIQEILIDFSKFRKLSRLNLNDTPITSLVSNFQKQSRIKHLNLSNTKLTNFTFMNNTQSLEILAIDNIPLNKLPTIITDLPHLSTLYASKIGIEEIPTSLLMNESIEALYFSHNNIIKISDKDFTNHTLKELDLSYNKIRQLPKNLHQLQRLMLISFNENPLPPYDIHFLRENNFCDQLRDNLDPTFPDILWLFEYIDRRDVMEICQEFLKDELSISEDDIERLVWELNPASRQLLEQKLPPTHPIFKKIEEVWSISTQEGYNFMI